MERVVYADLLWLIDFSMDLLALGIAGRITARPAVPWRVVCAAAIGGVWSVLSLVWGVEGVPGVALDLAVAAAMVALAYGRASPARFALTCGGFVGATVLLGGSMTALANLFVPADRPVSGGGFLLLALGGSGMTLLATRLRRRALPRHVAVTLTLDGSTLTLDAIADSGNLARDPLSGAGVIFVSPRKLRGWLSPALRVALLTGNPGAIAALPPPDARRLRMIPTTTVAGHSMVAAIRPDAVLVCGERSTALIAPLAAEDETEAIVPAELVPHGGVHMKKGKKVKP